MAAAAVGPRVRMRVTGTIAAVAATITITRTGATGWRSKARKEGRK
jgi:hypothetical protein